MKFEHIEEITDSEIQAALDFSQAQILRCLPEFTYRFQNAYSENGFYQPIDNDYWTTGFWTGEIWLAYEYTRNQQFLNAAQIQMDSFLDRINRKINVDHHDMGFLYSPSCVAGYKLTGSQVGREAALKAADQLVSRFQPKGAFIQAWGGMESAADYRLIIDCLLNVPLLYWASRETGNSRYQEIADQHVHTALQNVIREDYSTWHTFYFHPETGKPDHGATCQGFRDGSAWARGQAWGIYGTALAYRYTRDPEYPEIFRNVLEYYLNHLPQDMVPYWDLEFTSGDTQPRDSSSASIVACGMLEMAKYTADPEERCRYLHLSRQILGSLCRSYAVHDPFASNGLVLHSTYSNKSPYNTCNHMGVDECNSWGDYFYMEALTRLWKDWDVYW